MEESKDYLPLIKLVNAHIRYFIRFKDIHKQRNCIEVTEEVFLQFFGVHHHEKARNEEHYFIVFKDHEYCIKKEVTKERFLGYQSFRSMEIREQISMIAILNILN